MICEEPIQKKGDDIIEMAIEVLKESNSDSEIIDFDDMIYLPLALTGSSSGSTTTC